MSKKAFLFTKYLSVLKTMIKKIIEYNYLIIIQSIYL